jgi:hypothetical protein
MRPVDDDARGFERQRIGHGTGHPNAFNLGNLLRNMVSLQAKLAPPTADLSGSAKRQTGACCASLRSSGLMISGSA